MKLYMERDAMKYLDDNKKIWKYAQIYDAIAYYISYVVGNVSLV